MKKIFIFKTLTILVCSAFLAALSIVCGKYLAIPMGNVLRFSFENTPIMMAGMIFGPAVGAACGIVADLVGCVMVGYEINPIVTLGAGAIGLISGTLYYLLGKSKNCPYGFKVVISIAGAHLVGSVIIKTIGLSAFYSMPLFLLILWRFFNYLLVGAFEAVLLYYLLKNKTLTAEINSILGKRKR